MPHDCKGQPLAAGDKVTMEFEVKSVSAGENDCNVSLAAVDCPAHPQGYLPTLSCNSKLVTKCCAVLLLLAACLLPAPALAQDCAGGSCSSGSLRGRFARDDSGISAAAPGGRIKTILSAPVKLVRKIIGR